MSGRYQSKVFNFFSRQSLRLRDQSARTWRNVKLATVWGVQIVLYPVYVGFQTLRLTGKQLQQATQVLPRLRTPKPAADAPIRRTLEALGALEVRATGEHPLLIEPQTASQSDLERELALYAISNDQHRSELTPPEKPDLKADLKKAESGIPDVATVRIQGIASLLENGSLVLVTSRNQILDVLTFEQQTQLSRRITLELANYWQQQRLRMPVSNHWSRHLPLPKPQQNALPPIRLFRNLMSWMQRGSIATSVDLFQESRLTVYAPLPVSSNAELRSAQPSWITAEVQFYDALGRIGQSVEALLSDGLIAGRRAWVSLLTKGSLSTLPLPSEPTQLDSTSLSPPANWLTALDRWLSRVPGLQVSQLPPQMSQNWLTLDDLFEQPASVRAAEPTATASLLPASEPSRQQSATDSTSNLLRPGVFSWFQQALQQLSPGRLASLRATASNSSISTNWEAIDTAALEAAIKNRFGLQSPSFAKQSAKQSVKQLSNQTAMRQISVGQAFQIDHSAVWDTDLAVSSRPWLDELESPLSSLDTANAEEAAMLPTSWIETEAQLVGYVKHPLEQLLEWLDQGMVWLETRLTRVWKWLTRPIS